MKYLCLLCDPPKIFFGLGLRPHFYYKHQVDTAKVVCQKRKEYGWSRWHDYFLDGENIAVCLGDYPREGWVLRNVNLHKRKLYK